jgi:hypothetical protein
VAVSGNHTYATVRQTVTSIPGALSGSVFDIYSYSSTGI